MDRDIEVVKSEIRQLACEYMSIENWDNEDEGHDVLYLILSHSLHAIEFVIVLEDEFDIEFDDDDIDLDFFSTYGHIAKLVIMHAKKK